MQKHNIKKNGHLKMTTSSNLTLESRHKYLHTQTSSLSPSHTFTLRAHASKCSLWKTLTNLKQEMTLKIKREHIILYRDDLQTTSRPSEERSSRALQTLWYPWRSRFYLSLDSAAPNGRSNAIVCRDHQVFIEEPCTSSLRAQCLQLVSTIVTMQS